MYIKYFIFLSLKYYFGSICFLKDITVIYNSMFSWHKFYRNFRYLFPMIEHNRAINVCDISVWGEWEEENEGWAAAPGDEAQEAVGGASVPQRVQPPRAGAATGKGILWKQCKMWCLGTCILKKTSYRGNFCRCQ